MKLPIWSVDSRHSVSVTKGCAIHTRECWYGTGNYVPRDTIHAWIKDRELVQLPAIPDPPKFYIDLDSPDRFGPYCMPPLRQGRASGMSHNLLGAWLPQWRKPGQVL